MFQRMGLLFDLFLRPTTYLDPGSGSFILQLIIAGALGLGLALRSYWGRLFSFIRRLFSGGRSEGDSDPDDDA
jgi:hypothetical protein